MGWVERHEIGERSPERIGIHKPTVVPSSPCGLFPSGRQGTRHARTDSGSGAIPIPSILKSGRTAGGDWKQGTRVPERFQGLHDRIPSVHRKRRPPERMAQGPKVHLESTRTGDATPSTKQHRRRDHTNVSDARGRGLGDVTVGPESPSRNRGLPRTHARGPTTGRLPDSSPADSWTTAKTWETMHLRDSVCKRRLGG